MYSISHINISHTAFSAPLEIEVVVAKTYEAYYDLLLQMNSGVMIRAPRHEMSVEPVSCQGFKATAAMRFDCHDSRFVSDFAILNDPFPQTPRKKSV